VADLPSSREFTAAEIARINWEHSIARLKAAKAAPAAYDARGLIDPPLVAAGEMYRDAAWKMQERDARGLIDPHAAAELYRKTSAEWAAQAERKVHDLYVQMYRSCPSLKELLEREPEGPDIPAITREIARG
jgi:hypothetical protein